MPLKDGESELDTVVVKLPDAGISITSHESVGVTSSVLVPCDAFHLNVLADDPATSAVLLPGVRIQIYVNGFVQFTGTIDKRSIKASTNTGTTIQLSGRDILSPLIDSNVDPQLKFIDTMTLADVLASVLATYGITTIYNDGSLNVNLQTGVVQKPSLSSTNETVKLPQQVLGSDGSVNTNFVSKSVTIRASPKKTNLKSLTLAQLKPHEGEGTQQLIDRLLKRFGLWMHAAADGSGVIIDSPDFTTPAVQKIIHSRSSPDGNTVADGDVTYDLGAQPSCIVARGIGATSADYSHTQLVVIGINEIVGVDSNGNPLPAVQDIIARYKGAKVLPLRSQLNAFRKSYADALIARPMFVKDDESRTIEQLSGYVRRELATRQHKALVAKYTSEGLSQAGAPWATNTNVSVVDEALELNQALYLHEYDWVKSRQAGTSAKLSLCLPYSLGFDIGS